MAVMPDTPSPGTPDSPDPETPESNVPEAGAVSSLTSRRLRLARSRRHRRIGRPAAIGFATAGVLLLVALVLIGETATSPHPVISQSATAGAPSVNSVIGAIAVAITVAIVATAAVIALRLVLAEPDEPSEGASPDDRIPGTDDDL